MVAIMSIEGDPCDPKRRTALTDMENLMASPYRSSKAPSQPHGIPPR